MNRTKNFVTGALLNTLIVSAVIALFLGGCANMIPMAASQGMPQSPEEFKELSKTNSRIQVSETKINRSYEGKKGDRLLFWGGYEYRG